jgi:hypothetical protein
MRAPPGSAETNFIERQIRQFLAPSPGGTLPGTRASKH